MKTTIKNLILSAVLVVGGASCVDLDTAPYDRETDLTYWEEDPEAAVKALNTCYTYLGNMDEQLYSEAMTDNAYYTKHWQWLIFYSRLLCEKGMGRTLYGYPYV